jgi:group I intron endonuclease
MFTIYKHTNTVNGKSYVGYTKHTMQERFSQHISAANGGSKTPFHRAIRKHGARNWTSEVLFVAYTEQDAWWAEERFILENGTHKRYIGYNMTLGGDRGPILHGTSNGMWGKTHTSEVRQRLSQGAKDRYTGKSYEERHGEALAAILRQTRSEDMKRIRRSRSGVGTANPNFNPEVLTFQHILGETFVGTRQDFHTTHNVPRPMITALIKGTQRTAKGWRLA